MKTKFFLPVIILSIAGILGYWGCKTEDNGTDAAYDITGTWQVTSLTNVAEFTKAGTSQPPASATFKITFSGSLVNGTFTTTKSEVGTYLVIGTAVQWIFSNGTVYTGDFVDETTMEGDWVGAFAQTGTWNAIKE